MEGTRKKGMHFSGGKGRKRRIVDKESAGRKKKKSPQDPHRGPNPKSKDASTRRGGKGAAHYNNSKRGLLKKRDED